MMVEEELVVRANGTYHFLCVTTRNGKPFGEIEAWGNWRLEGDRLILASKRSVTQFGTPSEPPIVKEGNMPTFVYEIEWKSGDEWTSVNLPNSPSMKRVK